MDTKESLPTPADTATGARTLGALLAEVSGAAARLSPELCDVPVSAVTEALVGALRAAGVEFAERHRCDDAVRHAFAGVSPGDMLLLLGAQGMDAARDVLAPSIAARHAAGVASGGAGRAP